MLSKNFEKIQNGKDRQNVAAAIKGEEQAAQQVERPAHQDKAYGAGGYPAQHTPRRTKIILAQREPGGRS